jgi:hypothetical protein
MRAPALERAPALVEIGRLVIDAGDAGFVPTDVTQDSLDHMRSYLETIVQGGR